MITDTTSLHTSAYSFGLHAVIDKLRVLSVSPAHPQWSLFLINASTLLRNVYQSKMTPEQLVGGFRQDLIAIMGAINAYVETTSTGIGPRPVVCMYFPHYEDIPDEYRKAKFPIEYRSYVQVREQLISQLECVVGSNFAISMHFIDATGPWPHTTVVHDLKARYKTISGFNAVMLSNVPLDFHISKHIQRFIVLESYTGMLKPYKILGNKVIADEHVPFNKYTHILYGDKLFMRPQLSKSQLASISKIAAENHWELLSNISIAEAILDTGLVSKQILLAPEI